MVYKSTDLGGLMLRTLWRSWFPVALHQHADEQSWDGATLGCSGIVSVGSQFGVLFSTVDGLGNGDKTWKVTSPEAVRLDGVGL
jgi:hypothetical protein